MDFKKVINFLNANKVIIVFVLFFVGLITLIFILGFLSPRSRLKEDRSLGDIKTPSETYNTVPSLEGVDIFVGRDAFIKKWSERNKTFKVLDLASVVDIEAVANKFDISDRGTDDFFEEWVGDYGNLYVYDESIRVEVSQSNIFWDTSKLVINNSPQKNKYVDEAVEDIFGYSFPETEYVIRKSKSIEGLDILVVEGVLKLDDNTVVYDGWSDVFVSITLYENGMVKWLKINRFVPDTENSGVYAGYTYNELIESLRLGDIDSKIFRTRIDLSKSATYSSEGSDSYLVEIDYSSLNIDVITIRSLSMMYFVDKDEMVVVPMINIIGDVNVSKSGGIESGWYQIEIWYANVK